MNSKIKRGQGLFFASAALILFPKIYEIGQKLWLHWQGIKKLPLDIFPWPIFLLSLVLLWFALRGNRLSKVIAGIFLLMLGCLGIASTLYLSLLGGEREFVLAALNWSNLLEHLGFSIVPALLLLFAKPIAAFQAYQRGETDDHEASLSAIGSK